MQKLLIVIPAHNEEASIVPVVRDLIENYPQYDYVVVNDGSRDKTAALCRQNGFRLIDLPVNLGLAGAFQTGLRFAAENGYDSFSTTLLISPYQNHELIIKTAQAMAKKYHVTFLYRDFRPYFKEGQEKARAMGLYMQKYCGCVFSEEDRFLDRKKGLVTIQKYNNRKEEDAGHKTGSGKDTGDQDSRKEKSL